MSLMPSGQHLSGHNQDHRTAPSIHEQQKQNQEQLQVSPEKI